MSAGGYVNGGAAAAQKKKPAAIEVEGSTDAAELLKKYSDLMREAGSLTGTWNPDPDEQLTGALRHDVHLSGNEWKFVMIVKACCVRRKPMGRTVWGWTETGKPLRLTEIAAIAGWIDLANAQRYADKLLALGFVRKNADDQYGIGGRVQGTYEEPAKPNQPPPEEDELVCTDKLPDFLAEQIKPWSKPARAEFLRGWRLIRANARERLAKQKREIYADERNELTEHCKAFPLVLERGRAKNPEKQPENPTDLSVQTSSPATDDLSEQTTEDGAYTADSGSVQTTHIRKERKGQSLYGHSSSSEPAATEPATTTTTDKASRIRLAKALRDRGATPDGEALEELISNCRGKSADCTVDEIEHFVHEKASALPRDVRNAMAWFKTAVPKCFNPESLAAYRESVAAAAARERETAEARERLAAQAEAWEPPRREPMSKPPGPSLKPEEISDIEHQIADANRWVSEHPEADALRIRAANNEIRRLSRKLAEARA